MNTNPFEALETKLEDIDSKLELILQRDARPITPTQRFSTRPQTAERLRITLPTLHLYTKMGLIDGSRIGNRVLYSEEAIQAAVKSIPTLRRRAL